MTLTFHEESVDVGPLPRWMPKVISGLLGDVHSQSHLVQGPEVLPGDALQDGWRRKSITQILFSLKTLVWIQCGFF